MKIKLNLHTKLVSYFVFLSIVPLFIISSLAFKNGKETLKANLGKKLEESAHNSIDKIDRLLFNSRQNIKAWAATEVMQDMVADDPDGRITETLISLKKEYGVYSGIYAINPKGIIVASSDSENFGKNVSKEVWFQSLSSKKDVVIDDLQYSKLVEGFAVSFYIPIVASFDRKRIIGYLRALFNWSEFFEISSSINVSGNGQTEQAFAALADKNGYVISGPGFLLKSKENNKKLSDKNFIEDGYQSIKYAINHNKGYLVEKGPKNEEWLIGYSGSKGHRSYEGLGWSFLIFQKTDDAFSPIVELRRQTFIIGFLVILFSFVLAQITAKKLSKPILKLQDTAIKVAKGDFSQSVEVVHSKDEIEELSKTFNRMVHDLKSSRDEILESKEIAERANYAKTDFLARMSHELRTPMNAILGFAQIIQMDAKKNNDANTLDSIERVLRGGKHLLELINEVLDLSQIETGNLKLSLEPVNIVELKKELMDIVGPLADEKRIKIVDTQNNGLELFLLADRIRLKQVLLNLVSNGIKYNKTDGTLTFDIREKGDNKLEISVEDTGEGIPEDKQIYIFKPFERLGHENSIIEGSGIGLTISKRLIESMQGSIGFESKVGKGSRFFIELNLCEKPNFDEKSLAQNSGLPIVETKKKNKKLILYVEDNPANLDLVKRIFNHRKDIKLISAPDALRGIELAQKNQPDLILMDINLPGMDGIAAFKKLKEKNETKNIPIIAVSADAMQVDKKKALDAGFVEYITKPLDITIFLEKVNQIIQL